jgi:methionyl-tRNA formyltransferase
MSNKIVFFGNERLGTGLGTSAPVLRSLINEGYDICAIVVAQSEMQKSRNSRTLEVEEVASAHNIPVLAPVHLNDIKDELIAMNAKAGVLIAYGKLIPKNIIDIFPRGIINIHPSLLPLHRGPIPIESVILNGEKETGVSLMKLVDKMDAGPIYAQAKSNLTGREYKDELATKLIELGAELLIENLPHILNGSRESIKQKDVLATYDERIKKEDGEMSFQKNAHELERQVRAYVGWPRSRTKIGSKDVIITRAHSADIDGTSGTLYFEGDIFGVHCSSGTLIIDKLIPAGKGEMTSREFLLGYTP